jgi:hypothetical protein
MLNITARPLVVKTNHREPLSRLTTLKREKYELGIVNKVSSTLAE